VVLLFKWGRWGGCMCGVVGVCGCYGECGGLVYGIV
jgi:hypothetical protein